MQRSEYASYICIVEMMEKSTRSRDFLVEFNVTGKIFSGLYSY